MKGTPKKNNGIDTTSIDNAMKEANSLTEATKRETVDKSKLKSKLVPVRLNEIDYNRLMGLFGSQGVKLARAGSIALYYVAEQLENGRLSITKAGIIDRRG